MKDLLYLRLLQDLRGYWHEDAVGAPEPAAGELVEIEGLQEWSGKGPVHGPVCQEVIKNKTATSWVCDSTQFGIVQSSF